MCLVRILQKWEATNSVLTQKAAGDKLAPESMGPKAVSPWSSKGSKSSCLSTPSLKRTRTGQILVRTSSRSFSIGHITMLGGGEAELLTKNRRAFDWIRCERRVIYVELVSRIGGVVSYRRQMRR